AIQVRDLEEARAFYGDMERSQSCHRVGSVRGDGPLRVIVRSDLGNLEEDSSAVVREYTASIDRGK
ncbi:MAG: hypothetical protein ACKN94_02030, partial [Pirellulaceae bacterium]